MATVRARRNADGAVLLRLPDGREAPQRARVDWSQVDATTEEQIARQEAEDDATARQDAAAWARQVRQGVGLTQEAFAARIGVPAATVRNWEQGKRLPRGPARALLRVIARAPETTLAALAPPADAAS